MKTLSRHKSTVHNILLAIQVLSPILMFTGVQRGWMALIYLGLAAIILANLTATLTK